MDTLMALYHIETQSLKSSKIYYLAKTIRLDDKVLKVREKLGNDPPSLTQKQELTSKPNLSLEIKALEKKISFGEKRDQVKYLQKEDVRRLEESRHWDYMSSLFLTQSEKEYFDNTSEIEYVHGTTAIEGNTFSLQQVDDLLFKEISPSDKSLREINEVQNYRMVQKYRDVYRGKVTLQFIRKLHEIIMDKIDTESAGDFRRSDSIGIRGLDIAVCPAILIEEKLKKIIEEYYTNIKKGYHPFEEATIFHYRFEMIHPFTDGNGRVGREILNHMLTKTGFPRLVVTKQDREKYLKALQSENQNKYSSMITGFIEILENNRATVFKEIIDRKYTT
jgi:Fic family protein